MTFGGTKSGPARLGKERGSDEAGSAALCPSYVGAHRVHVRHSVLVRHPVLVRGPRSERSATPHGYDEAAAAAYLWSNMTLCSKGLENSEGQIGIAASSKLDYSPENGGEVLIFSRRNKAGKGTWAKGLTLDVRRITGNQCW